MSEHDAVVHVVLADSARITRSCFPPTHCETPACMYRSPDHQADTAAPPIPMRWTESIRADGVAASFAGPAPGSFLRLMSVVLIASSLMFVGLLGFADLSAGVSRNVVMIPILMLGVSCAMAWKWRAGGPSAAAIDIDMKRLLLRSTGLFGRTIELPTVEVQGFYVEEVSQEVKSGVANQHSSTTTWYRVRADLGVGGKQVVAAFSDGECAAFLSARLESLLGGVRARIRS